MNVHVNVCSSVKCAPEDDWPNSKTDDGTRNFVNSTNGVDDVKSAIGSGERFA